MVLICFSRFTRIDRRMLSVDDANKLTVPLGIYISKDEPVDEVLLMLLRSELALTLCVG
jgi:hypothetical protein